jgi:hypothetical protein
MLVGEQPGDKEDLAGKPFVGNTGASSKTSKSPPPCCENRHARPEFPAIRQRNFL